MKRFRNLPIEERKALSHGCNFAVMFNLKDGTHCAIPAKDATEAKTIIDRISAEVPNIGRVKISPCNTLPGPAFAFRNADEAITYFNTAHDDEQA